MWLSLLFSALLYPLPFMFTASCWWLVFIFPFPLFYSIHKHALRFKHGFFWAIVTFTVHLSGPLYAAMLMAQGSWLIRIVPATIIIFYFALCTGIFFQLAWYVYRNKNDYTRFITFFCMLTFFFTWLNKYCLWPCGLQEGYFLMHPLLPLTQHPQLLYPMTMVDISTATIVFTCLLLCVPATAAFALRWTNNYSLFFFILSLVPWMFAYTVAIKQEPQPTWLSSLYCMPEMIFSHSSQSACLIQSMGKKLKTVIEHNNLVELIIMPESALNCTAFSDNPALMKLWGMQTLGKKIHIILGTFRWDGTHYHNSVYWMYDGTLRCFFDKRHAMLLVERLPNWLEGSCIQKLYFSFSPCVTIAQTSRPLMQITSEISFVPYICSELFFNEKPDDSYPAIPILALCNDSSFITPYYYSYVHKLMVLAARFKAVLWQRDIVYISYLCAHYINKNGTLV